MRYRCHPKPLFSDDTSHGRLTASGANTNMVAVNSYVYQCNLPNQRTRVNWADGSRVDYEYDALGQVIDAKRYWANGSLVARQQYGFTYDNIGNRTPATTTGSLTKENPFQFSTKYTDDEMGLVYYGYRHYNSSTGRWINRDPVEEDGGENLYGMAVNNPVGLFDFNGLNVVRELAEDMRQRMRDVKVNIRFFSDWLLNREEEVKSYGQNDRLTQLLMTSNGMKEIKSQISAGNCQSGRYNYETLQGYREGIFEGGYISNASEWQIGGFVLNATKTERKNSKGETVFQFGMINTATWRSLLGLNVLRNWLNNIPLVNIPSIPDLDRLQFSVGGTIMQDFKWEQGVCCLK